MVRLWAGGAAHPCEETVDPLIALGDRGEPVTTLQQRLTLLGYSPGPADGIFGIRTDHAVREFQDDNGLADDGIVGPVTWAALKGVATPPKPPGGTLGVGSKGAEVATAQQQLSSRGYWLGIVDGVFGALTQQAVWAFQKVQGVPRTGVLNTDDRQTLSQARRPTPGRTGDQAEIDLGKQTLFIIRGQDVVVALNTSTGNGERYYSGGQWKTARTPTGDFKIVREVNGMRVAPLGKLWRPRYFTNSGYAVHGSSSIPPHPASHGCARVSNPAMNMIWDHNLLPMGSAVWVHP